MENLRLKATLEEMREHIREKHKRETHLISEIRQARKEAEENVRERFQQLEEALRSLRAELKAKADKIRELELENQALRAENDTLKSTTASSSHEIGDMRAMMTQMMGIVKSRPESFVAREEARREASEPSLHH